MQVDTEPAARSGPPPRVPSPMITVTEQDDADAPAAAAPDVAAATSLTATAAPAPRQLTPTRERKKSPATGVSPRQRKRSQPVRGELLPDPDKLLSYKHHDKKEDEDLEDPTFPGGHPKPPPEPRAPGQPAERKRSNVTFCPVVQTIEK